MNFFVFNPELPGNVGAQAVMDYSGSWPKPVTLHYELEDIPVDDIIAGSLGVTLASPPLCEALKSKGLTGFRTEKALLTASDICREMNDNAPIPPLLWVVIDGIAGVNDFGIFDGNNLVVSNTALEVIKQHSFQKFYGLRKFTPAVRRELWEKVSGRTPDEALDESVILLD